MKKIAYLVIVTLFTSFFFIGCEELFGIEDEEEDNVVACGDYVRPPNIDNQYDYQCQAAYAYKCNGQLEALKKQCEYYKLLQKQLNLPDCSYCK